MPEIDARVLQLETSLGAALAAADFAVHIHHDSDGDSEIMIVWRESKPACCRCSFGVKEDGSLYAFAACVWQGEGSISVIVEPNEKCFQYLVSEFRTFRKIIEVARSSK